MVADIVDEPVAGTAVAGKGLFFGMPFSLGQQFADGSRLSRLVSSSITTSPVSCLGRRRRHPLPSSVSGRCSTLLGPGADGGGAHAPLRTRSQCRGSNQSARPVAGTRLRSVDHGALRPGCLAQYVRTVVLRSRR